MREKMSKNAGSAASSMTSAGTPRDNKEEESSKLKLAGNKEEQPGVFEKLKSGSCCQ